MPSIASGRSTSITAPETLATSSRAFAIVVCLGLVFASAFMALVPSAALLIVAIFLLRQFGQGLASHTGKTATARFFHIDRG